MGRDSGATILGMDRSINAIVQAALELSRTRPDMPVGNVLDAAAHAPIPSSLLPEFVSLMVAVDDSDTAQGEWWFFLEETAERFIDKHGLQGHASSAVSQYLATKSEQRLG
jgi:hypothetical protein